MATDNSARRNTLDSQVFVDRDSLPAKQLLRQNLTRHLADRERELGACAVDTIDVDGSVDACNHRHIGRQVFEYDRGKHGRRVSIDRQYGRLSLFETDLFERPRVQDVTDYVDPDLLLAIDDDGLLADIGQ